jgi:hypothetical protein
VEDQILGHVQIFCIPKYAFVYFLPTHTAASFSLKKDCQDFHASWLLSQVVKIQAQLASPDKLMAAR